MPLVVYFLNVGHGDCTIVEFPSGRLAMIDINSNAKLPEEDKQVFLKTLGYSDYQIKLAEISGQTLKGLDRYEKLLVDPISFFKVKYSGQPIFRLIITHPDMDHLSGLYSLHKQSGITLLNIWDTDHTKDFSEEEFKDSPYEYLDWLTYKILRLGNNGLTVIKNKRNAAGQYWTDDGIHILSPTGDLEKQAQETENYNLSSYVLLLQYGHSKVILGGDADEATWQDIYFAYQDDFLKAGLLKASHHGRKSGYYQPIVKAIAPKYVIVSVGKKPETDASDLYAQYSSVFSTRYHGTITAKCWFDGDIWLYDCNGNRIDNS